MKNYVHKTKVMSEEEKLLFLHRENLSAIFDPSLQVQQCAIMDDPEDIAFIKNPEEALQILTVKRDGQSIQYIENPSADVQLAAVKDCPASIRFLFDPHPEVIAWMEDNWPNFLEEYFDLELDSKIDILVEMLKKDVAISIQNLGTTDFEYLVELIEGSSLKWITSKGEL